MMDNREYITFLLDQGLYPKSFRYGISTIPVDGEESSEQLVDFQIGFNCCLDLNTTVVKVGEVSVLLKIQYFDQEHDLRIYCHPGVSPKEFFERVDSKIWDHFLEIQKDEKTHQQLKDYYETEKKKLYGRLGGEIKKQLDDWKNN